MLAKKQVMMYIFIIQFFFTKSGGKDMKKFWKMMLVAVHDAHGGIQLRRLRR